MNEENILKNYLLTDFTTERWHGADLESVKICLGKIKDMYIYGEIGNPDGKNFSLCRFSHTIKNIQLVDDKIYGDVKFLETESGIKARDCMNSGEFMFGVRSDGVVGRNGEITFDCIYTWDVIQK